MVAAVVWGCCVGVAVSMSAMVTPMDATSKFSFDWAPAATSGESATADEVGGSATADVGGPATADEGEPASRTNGLCASFISSNKKMS